jgi:general L-amino acid transport system permease protein
MSPVNNSRQGGKMAVETTASSSSGYSLWTDPKFRSIITQLVVVALFAGFIYFIVDNTTRNLESRGIATGFGFLSQPAGFDVASSLIEYNPTMSHGRVFFVGLLNTLMVAAIGVVLATFLGFTVGVLRLSHNWVISRLAYVYVESLRNIPVLLQIIFWWAVFLALPKVRNAISFGDSFYLSNRGLQMPSPIFEPGSSAILIGFVIAVVASIIIRVWAKKRQELTGQQFPVFLTVVGLIIGLPLIGAVIAGFPVSFEIPVKKGFNFQGGFTVTPEFMAVLVALSVYTGCFIAELVRAGIQAISHGQTEAAFALGLRPGVTTRLVIIPQAMRIIVPPLTSQYLNLTKNSSLAIAVGYPDLVSTFGGTTLNQTGQAVEIIGIVMGVYLTISLITSAFMNWYNKRIALVER